MLFSCRCPKAQSEEPFLYRLRLRGERGGAAVRPLNVSRILFRRGGHLRKWTEGDRAPTGHQLKKYSAFPFFFPLYLILAGPSQRKDPFLPFSLSLSPSLFAFRTQRNQTDFQRKRGSKEGEKEKVKTGEIARKAASAKSQATDRPITAIAREQSPLPPLSSKKKSGGQPEVAATFLHPIKLCCIKSWQLFFRAMCNCGEGK